jgi:dihydrofolate reductase
MPDETFLVMKTRELTSDLFVTIDGFASGVDVGPFFGYSGPDLDAWVRANLDQPQILVMGRVTYEAMARISANASDLISARMNELPKMVVSSTLREPLAWRNTRLLSGDVPAGIEALKRERGDPLRTIGSISLVRSLLALDLVDRLRLVVFPLILGRDGREPAFADFPRTSFERVDSSVLDASLVAIEYRRTRIP